MIGSNNWLRCARHSGGASVFAHAEVLKRGCAPVRSEVLGLREICCCRCDPTSRPGQPTLLQVQALASVGRPHRHIWPQCRLSAQLQGNARRPARAGRSKQHDFAVLRALAGKQGCYCAAKKPQFKLLELGPERYADRI